MCKAYPSCDVDRPSRLTWWVKCSSRSSHLFLPCLAQVVSAFVCAGVVVLVGAGLCYYVIDPLEQVLSRC
jgi:hypothetical protein